MGRSTLAAVPLADALAALDRAVEDGRFPRPDYAERKRSLRARVGGDGTVEVPEGWLGLAERPAPTRAPAPGLYADLAVPGRWLSTALRVLGVLSVLGGLVGLVVGLGEATTVDYDGHAYGPSGGAVALTLTSLLSALVSAVVLFALAQVLDVLREVTARPGAPSGRP